MKRWQTVDSAAPAEAEKIAKAHGLSLPLASLLLSRGYETPETIDGFLHPRLSNLSDPFELVGLREAAERIRYALGNGERIVVFGDYDVDGVTSTALLVKVLASLGGAVVPFLPHRVDDGYGLSCDALDKCLSENDPGLIVTVDCGTGSVEAVERARAAGVDVVVTDHHEPGDKVAKALVVVNPKLSGQECLQILAGVGVTFKLCHGLLKLMREEGVEAATAVDLRGCMDLVALGTVADVVPLVGENRALVQQGLRCMTRTENTGLRALVHVAGITGAITAYHVGFILGPRLNAAGRLDDAMEALELLLTTDAERAFELAQHLDGVNQERQAVERGILELALSDLDARFDSARDYAVVVAGEGWHPGVVGIVASRICERYYRPTVVIGLDADGRGRGSCRSIDGFNILEALDKCADLLVKYGGHAMAAGLEIEAEKLPAFKARLAEVAGEQLGGSEPVPTQRIDGWVDLGQADEDLLAGLEAFQPFGHKNPTPVWATRGVSVVGKPRIVGKGHLKIMVASGAMERECIGFNLGERPLPDGPIDIAYQLKMNSFRGRESLQLTLKDFRAAE